MGTLLRVGVTARVDAHRVMGGLAPAVRAFTAASLLLMALAACSPSRHASDLEMPAVRWERPLPTGGLEDSDWAVAARRANDQLTLARLYADYSDPDLIAARGYDRAEGLASNYGDYYRSYPSDEPTVSDQFRAVHVGYSRTLAIDVADDGNSAVVHMCSPAPISADDYFVQTQGWFVSREAGGRLEVRETVAHDPEQCSQADLILGDWEVPFDPAELSRGHAKMPLPREYYVKLGVISE